MPLHPIPPDPEPTEAEIDAEIERKQLGARGDVIRRLARLVWRERRRREQPDDFLVPFATELKDYPKYLRSARWLRIRDEVLAEADHRCAACGGRATQVHHRDYRPRVLKGDDRTPLVAICGPCHDVVHEGRDPSWQEQERRLREMVSRCDASASLARPKPVR
jgi:5-methylcytosine-specific restriction endonuclease McrA